MLNILAPLMALAFVACWTPGPNNILVANSGASFGLQRSLPHVLGIALGFPVMIFLVGLFLGELFQSSAELREGLRWISAAILLWLAWKIATSGGLSAHDRAPRPFTFVEAAAFQWINPKAWAMAIAVTGQFMDSNATVRSAILIALCFVVMGLSSATTWAAAGQGITRWVNTEDRLRKFNLLMGAIVAGCVVVVFLD